MTQTVKNAARAWIPSIYILEGLPFALVTAVSLILYQNFHFTNARITFFTSLLTIPWILKPIIAPYIANLATKRSLILAMPFCMILGTVLLVLCLFQENFFYSSLVIFMLIGFVSSIFDMNADGYYITQLTYQDQARYVGIRTVCYQMGRLCCQGILVLMVGLLINTVGLTFSWQLMLLVLAGFIALLALWTIKILPKEAIQQQQSGKSALAVYASVYHALVKLPHLLAMMIFFIVYSIAENQLLKVVPLFLLDHTTRGGLALPVADIAVVVGGIGLMAMLVGIVLSGFILARASIVRCLLPMTLFMVMTNVGYIVLSVTGAQQLFLISVIVAIAQFGFGLSNGLYMLCLLRYFGQGEHAMPLYAIGTAVMGASVVIGGAISGYVQSLLGYTNFFIWIVLINILISFYAYYILQLRCFNENNAS